MHINEDFIEDIELDTNNEVEPSDSVVCKYGFAFTSVIRQPNAKRLKEKVNKVMGKLASVSEYYFERLSYKGIPYTGLAKHLKRQYDAVIMFNGELKPRELYSLVEQLLKIGQGFYELLVCIQCEDMGNLNYDCFSFKLSDTLKGIMDMLIGSGHKNKWVYNLRKNIPKYMIHELSFMTDYSPKQLSEYYIYHYRVPERLALSISYNGFDSFSVDCSMLNGLKLADQEPLGWQRYLRVAYDDIETCIYNNDTPGIEHIDFYRLPNFLKKGKSKLLWCSGALNPTSRYITFVAYIGTDGADSFFIYMNLQKEPMMLKEFSETLYEITRLPENEPRIQKVLDNFQKASKIAEHMR